MSSVTRSLGVTVPVTKEHSVSPLSIIRRDSAQPPSERAHQQASDLSLRRPARLAGTTSPPAGVPPLRGTWPRCL